MSEGEERTHVWERIEQIATRIRALSCWGKKLSDDEAFSPICSRYDDGRPFFPNLRVLSVYRVPMLSRCMCFSGTRPAHHVY